MTSDGASVHLVRRIAFVKPYSAKTSNAMIGPASMRSSFQPLVTVACNHRKPTNVTIASAVTAHSASKRQPEDLSAGVAGSATRVCSRLYDPYVIAGVVSRILTPRWWRPSSCVATCYPLPPTSRLVATSDPSRSTKWRDTAAQADMPAALNSGQARPCGEAAPYWRAS